MLRERVPIAVELITDLTGNIIPRRVIYEYDSYPVERNIGNRIYCPFKIPVEGEIHQYTVIISGYTKHLYHEVMTNKWFSVKNEDLVVRPGE